MKHDPEIDALVAVRLIDLARALTRSSDIKPEDQATALLKKIVQSSGEARAAAIEEAECFFNYRPVLMAKATYFK